jgi:hypothetical protein
MSSRDDEVYAALARGFGSLGLRWYVFGAQAAIIHGAVRFTEDIDVTVDPAGVAPSVLVAALRAEGFSPRVDDDEFIAQTRVIPVTHEPTGVPVDIVLAGPGIEDLFFDGARPTMIGNTTVPVARAEDLVAMKILAGRPKDIEDCTAIIAAAAEHFDERRTRGLLEALEQALDQSDLLPAFAECRQRAALARRRGTT